MNIRWRNTTGSVNENVAVVPPGSNILSFPFKEASYSSPSSMHLKFHSACFLLCHILWLCVVSIGIQSNSLSLSFFCCCQQARFARVWPLLRSCFTVFFSPAENREPLIYGSMPRLCPQGAPRVLQQIFLLFCRSFFYPVILIYSVA